MDEEVKERLDRIQEFFEELNEAEWEYFSTYVSISQGINTVKDVKKVYFTPEKPDTCEGFIGDCNNKPSKYYDLKDSWYCIRCYNEMARHYGG